MQGEAGSWGKGRVVVVCLADCLRVVKNLFAQHAVASWRGKLPSAVPLANCNFNGLQEVKLKLQWSISLFFPQSLILLLSLFTWRMRNKNARVVNALWTALNCCLALSTLTFALESFLFKLGLK